MNNKIKKILSLLVVLFICSNCVYAYENNTYPKEHTSNYNFYIYHCTLKSNPSTGDYWIPDYNSQDFKYLGSKFVADNSNVTGSPGNQTFFFKALKEDVPNSMKFCLINPEGSILKEVNVDLSKSLIIR